MKIQILIAGSDNDYIRHLANVLNERYYDTFEVSICTSKDHLVSMMENKKYDVSLIEPNIADAVDLSRVKLSLLLWDNEESYLQSYNSMKRVKKYQRVSSIVSEVLEAYAEVSTKDDYGLSKSKITVVWSPVGGCGKTTVALAYAAHAVAEGKKVTYLDMEAFSSTMAFFSGYGKSISTVFEKLGSNVEILLQGIRQYDNGSGINYYCQPDNYEDISILTVDDVENLVMSCGRDADEIVVDISSNYDKKVFQLMNMASKVLLVTDSSKVGEMKLKIFRTQNNVYESIKEKTVLVVNRGGKVRQQGEARTIYLPMVQSDDPVVVYKTLSAGYFNM